MHTERCPACYGKGVVYGVAETGAYPTTPCYGCQSKGWVEVADDIPYIVGGIIQPFIDPSRCPSCGGNRNSPAGAGCPMGSHYGTW